MPTFKKLTGINTLVEALMSLHEDHKPLLEAKVRIDFLLAFPDLDEKTGKPINDAIRKGGIRCLGCTRKIKLSDRVKGMGDAEIMFDGPNWEAVSEAERNALLDHELMHLALKMTSAGPARDDIGRPVLELRKHDVEMGWFKKVAARNGAASVERKQATELMQVGGQYFWPAIYEAITSPARAEGRFQRLEQAITAQA